MNTDFAKHLAAGSSIVELMDDLGQALNVDPSIRFLGGGNPDIIPAFEHAMQTHMQVLEMTLHP